MKYKFLILICIATSFYGCNTEKSVVKSEQPLFDWDAANVYFLLTDRFKNGDESNDNIIARNEPAATLRGMEGGDFKGIIQKLKEGYFTDLGINAIWLSPVWEQVHGAVDEGTGVTYPFHGYWAKDFTKMEPSFGTAAEFQELVDLAHKKNIRIILDVVLNHTGPVTEQDPLWSEDWLRIGPVCTYADQATAMTCTLTDNLPDFKTESSQEVSLPQLLIDKWKKEGRYEKEVKELDAFFNKTKLPRTPANYLIKWVSDYTRDFGVDGYRVDTVKHVEEGIWTVLINESRNAFEQWKKENPSKKWHDDALFVVGELYGYESSGGRNYPFGEQNVDYFDSGYDAMINFGFKRHATASYEELFFMYDRFRESLITEKPNNPVAGMNYISSHDDGDPYDPLRKKSIEAGTKLLLTPGISQVYYGDESGRILKVEGATGDANLRSNMNWDAIDKNTLSHYQKLGKFRNAHVSVGAGQHLKLVPQPQGILAARIYAKGNNKDAVIIGSGLKEGLVKIPVNTVFPNETSLRNAYTGKTLKVVNGFVESSAVNGVILLEKI